MASPKPTCKFNSGPAKQAVKAVGAMPSLDMAMLAYISPVEFPQDRRVRPSSVVGNLDTSPIRFSRSTSESQMNIIQKIDIIKLM